MGINNTPKPSVGTFNNTAKVSTQVTWDTNTTTWNTETRTWNQMASFFNNTAKPSAGTFNNTPKPSA